MSCNQPLAAVRRSAGAHRQGLEFDVPLISDGADGLCTRHRVSPYVLAAAGMPLGALPVNSMLMEGLDAAKRRIDAILDAFAAAAAD